MNNEKLLATKDKQNSEPLCSNPAGPPSTSKDYFSDVLTEEELIAFLRIPSISNAKNYHNVIENLKRMHNLPRISLCGKPLYPKEAIKQWIKKKTINGE